MQMGKDVKLHAKHLCSLLAVWKSTTLYSSYMWGKTLFLDRDNTTQKNQYN